MESKDSMAYIVRDIYGDLKSAGKQAAEQGKVAGRTGVVIEAISGGIMTAIFILIGLLMIGMSLTQKAPTEEEKQQGKQDNRLIIGVVGFILFLIGSLVGLSTYKNYLLTQQSGMIAGAKGIGYAASALRSSVF